MGIIELLLKFCWPSLEDIVKWGFEQVYYSALYIDVTGNE
jgi:hypothetical protein